MLSDQRNETFRKQQRFGFGNKMLGPSLQAGGFARTAPNVAGMNASRGVNSLASRGFAPGSGFGEIGSQQTPNVAGPAALGGLLGPPGLQQQHGPESNPLLAQLGMLMMAQQQGGR